MGISLHMDELREVTNVSVVMPFRAKNEGGMSLTAFKSRKNRIKVF